MTMLVRFVGDTPESEPVETGRGSRWWPGEVRVVDDAIGLALVAAHEGWEACRESDTSGALTADEAKALRALVSGAGIPPTHPALLAVVIGNSIAGGASGGPGRNSGVRWQTGSDLHTALYLTGGAGIRFGRITASTRADGWGVYSYSGQTLATINSDLAAQLYAPLVSASLVPDLIIGHSLLENDIAAGATYAQCLARLQRWEYEALGRYPSAMLWVMTPRPSYSYNTPAKVAVYQQISDYIMGRDDGRTWWATRLNAYENPAAPGTPLAGYTDASVHPNTLGGMANGRTMAETLRRINGTGRVAYRCVSANFALDGTTAATGTNVSGTTATGTSYIGTSNGVIVCAANQPGVTIALTQTAGQAFDIATFACGQVNVSGTQFSPYIIARIDSGGSQLRSVGIEARVYDGTTSPFVVGNALGTADADGDYRDGDILTMRMPPIVQADSTLAGAITSIQPYLRATRKTAGGSTVLEGGTVQLTVLDAGVGLVA